MYIHWILQVGEAKNKKGGPSLLFDATFWHPSFLLTLLPAYCIKTFHELKLRKKKKILTHIAKSWGLTVSPAAKSPSISRIEYQMV